MSFGDSRRLVDLRRQRSGCSMVNGRRRRRVPTCWFKSFFGDGIDELSTRRKARCPVGRMLVVTWATVFWRECWAAASDCVQIKRLGSAKWRHRAAIWRQSAAGSSLWRFTARCHGVSGGERAKQRWMPLAIQSCRHPRDDGVVPTRWKSAVTFTPPPLKLVLSFLNSAKSRPLCQQLAHLGLFTTRRCWLRTYPLFTDRAGNGLLWLIATGC